jgi:hypothetical protein
MRNLLLLLFSVFACQAIISQKRVVDYPYYEERNSYTMYDDVSKLVLDEKETLLVLHKFSSGNSLLIDKGTALVGNTTGKRYKLLSADGVVPGDTLLLEKDLYKSITLHFEPLDATDTSFDLVEGKSVINGISTLAYDVAELRAWGKDALSPFKSAYVCGNIYIKGKAEGYTYKGVKSKFYSRLAYPAITGIQEEISLKGEFFHTIPVYNTTMLDLYSKKHYLIIAEPGDTVEINFDGNDCEIISNKKYETLCKEISDYYNKSYGVHDVHNLMVESVRMQGMYDCMQGMLCRRLLSLQKYMEKNSSLSPEAVYLLRSGIKSEVLTPLTRYVSYVAFEKDRSLSPEYMEFINELLAASTVPATMNISPSYAPVRALLSYEESYYRFYQYRNDGFSSGAWVSDIPVMLLEKQRKGDITMSEEEVEIVKKYPLCYTLKRARKTAEDSIRYACEIAECDAVIEAYKGVVAKYPFVTPTEKDVAEARENLMSDRCRKVISRLPLPVEEIKYIRTVLLCRRLDGMAGASIRSGEAHKRGEDALSPAVLKLAMDGLENFPLAPVIVEYNERLRRPGSTEE